MLTVNIQELADEYTAVVQEHGKLRAIMAIRAYGACIAANEKPSLPTIEKFYDELKPLLWNAYRTKLSHLSSYEVLAVERAIAVNIYNVIQDMLNGCIR